MQKLERLLNLTALLLHSGRPLSATELRERVPGYPDGDTAFHRAFERDKDDLREMGIPLELAEIPGADPPLDGYLIPRGRYYLPDPGLDAEELAALQLAAAAVRLDGFDGVEALWKLGGSGSTGARGPALAEIPSDPNLAPLFDAVSRRAPARFRYNEVDREVHAYRIGFTRGHWYLRAFDVGRDDVRLYRIDRIDGAVTLGGAGAYEVPPDDADAEQMLSEGWQLGVDPPVTCRLLVDPSHAALALEHLVGATTVEERPDGGVVLELVVTNREAFRGTVLTYLEHAEVLAPEEIRREIVDWLRHVPGATS